MALAAGHQEDSSASTKPLPHVHYIHPNLTKKYFPLRTVLVLFVVAIAIYCINQGVGTTVFINPGVDLVAPSTPASPAFGPRKHGKDIIPMPDDPSPTSSAGAAGASSRRVLTGEESSQFRHRPPANRLSTTFEPPTPGIRRSSTDAPNLTARRRSSNFSDYSLNEARKSFKLSTDDLLLPKPSVEALEAGQDSSAWHSAPLAFALLPAIGGMLFKNGSSVITDFMLLGLAAIFLNWSVRVPWDWYHSAQSIRKSEEYNGETTSEDCEDENALSSSQATLDEVPEEVPSHKSSLQSPQRIAAHDAAANALHTHEVLALLSCFLFPMLGAYLLHTIRSQLSRPSEGLVSDYNLTIFLLASELRPMAHLVKLIRSRTLHLQRVVAANPHEQLEEKSAHTTGLLGRIEALEARNSISEHVGNSANEAVLNSKQSAILTAEIRRNLQPDLDALNRAVRRYEKRATLQTFQTESRLLELEARLNDAISLAAAATNNGQRQRGFTGIIVEWVATAIVLPVHAFSAIASLPFTAIVAVAGYARTLIAGPDKSDKKRPSTAKHASYGRFGDRVQSRVGKR